MFKKLFKKSRIYRFFHNNFKMLNDSIQNDEIGLKKEVEELKQQIYLTNLKLENIYAEMCSVSRKTTQLENTNIELLSLKPTEKQKVLLVGFYGAPNSGDELMMQSILEKMDSTKTSITVMIVDNPKYKLINYSNINYIHYPKTNLDINFLANYFDKIIFGGGAIIEDKFYDDPESYKYNTATVLIELSLAAIINNKKVYCVGLSSSKELSNEEYIAKLDEIIDKSEYFSLRDANSIKTLKKSGIKNLEKIQVIKDLAFSLDSKEYKLKNNDEIVVGLVLLGFNDIEKLSNILQWLNNYFDGNNKKVKFKAIPFYNYNNYDSEELRKLVDNSKMEDKIEVLPYYQSYNDISKAFLSCDYMVDMRYHASLLSLKFGIPSIHIICDMHHHYENKMNDLKEKYGLPEMFLSYTKINEESLDKALDYALKNNIKINKKEIDVTKKLEKQAIEEHMEIINKILDD